MIIYDKCEWMDVPLEVPSHVSVKPFTLQFPVESKWDSRDNRILVIIQEVASADLKQRALCTSTYGVDLSNTLSFAFQDAQRYTKKPLKARDFSFAVVNYQSAPTYSLIPAHRSAVEAAMGERIAEVVKELDPTHILCMGDDVSRLFKPSFDVNTRGWAEELKVYGKKRVVCSTLDLSLITNKRAFTSESEDDEEEGEEVGDRDMYGSAGLIETIIRNVRNLFLHDQFPRGNPHHVDVKPKWKVLTTVEEVEDMVEELRSAPCFAVDTETRDLNRIDNKLLIMQFASEAKDYAYIVPFRHKDSPFDSRERKKIRRLIYDLLQDFDVDPFDDKGYIVGVNLQFDVTQLRQQLSIPLITRPIWDLQNGEYLIDENQGKLDAFAGAAPKAFSLAAIALRYGCDAFLEKDGFNKADRVNMEATSLEDESFLDYCALDVLIPLAIHREQLKRAEVIGYKKFKRLCLIQQSANEMSAANMEHRGILLDIPYLESLLNKGSKLDALIDEATVDIMHTKGVKEASKIIKASKGLSDDSLFGGIVEDDESMFNPAKAEHQQVLFQDVLDLEPVMGFQKKERENGKPFYRLGKAFQQAHRFVFEVALFNRINKLKKMKSAYVSAFLDWVKGTADGRKTGRMRPSFGFIYVVTGRSNSFKPSLQQTPSRGKESKIIKRAFIAPKGHLRLATDYSANEVRFAANISDDEAMAHPFIVARQLRKELYRLDCREQLIKKELKRRGIPLPEKEDA